MGTTTATTVASDKIFFSFQWDSTVAVAAAAGGTIVTIKGTDAATGRGLDETSYRNDSAITTINWRCNGSCAQQCLRLRMVVQTWPV